jgi:hypothetical protein
MEEDAEKDVRRLTILSLPFGRDGLVIDLRVLEVQEEQLLVADGGPDCHFDGWGEGLRCVVLRGVAWRD